MIKSTAFQQLLFTSVISVLVTLPAKAAVLEEVIVTAQKREQNVQDVGIAITAMTGEQMEALGYTNAQQVTAMAPGVSTIQPNGEANYAIGIRGVANSDFTTNVESPVAVYLDEVYISQMSGTGFMLFDMERVEILKGPQGTLFGRNATGGLAHFLTRKPSQETDGYVKLTYGDYEQFKAEGALGGPLSDSLSGRISFSHHQNDGYVTNEFPGSDTLNNADDQSWRAQLLYEPDDALSVLLNYRGSQQDIRTGFFEHVTTTDTGQLQGGSTFNPVLGYTEVDANTDPYNGSFDEPGFNDLETQGFSGTVKWNFNNALTFTSITDYSTVERTYIEDSDASPARVFNFFLNTDAEQFSQELRLEGQTDRINWVAGLYYLDLKISDNNGIVTDAFIEAPPEAGGFGLITPFDAGVFNPYTSDLESISGFGQLEYAFNDSLSGTVGVRVINDQKDYQYFAFVTDFPNFGSRNYLGGTVNVANIINDFFGQGTSYTGTRDDTEISFRAQADYKPDDDSLYYASFNRGVKSGGFNAVIFPFSDPTLGYNDDTFSYDPEILDAWEVGFKKTLMDGLARLNGSAYYYDYKDYQAFEIIGVDTLTRNAEAESYGFELELQATPTEQLDVILGLAYNDIDVTLASGTPTTSVQSPKFTFNGLARYEWPFMNGRLAVQGDMEYRDEHFFSLAGIEAVREDGYVLANASVTFTSADEKWALSGFVNNLTDEEYLVQTFELGLFLGMTEQYYGRPRWWGISGRYNF